MCDKAEDVLKTFKIRIKDDKLSKLFISYIFKYKQFDNLFILLLQEIRCDFNFLSNSNIMRAVLSDTEGGKKKVEVAYIKNKYKTNDKLNQLIILSKDLKIHNLVYSMKRIKGAYKTFFTKVKSGDKTVKLPKAKKLSLVSKYSILLDNANSISLKNKDKIGINLNGKMIHFDFDHKYLPKNIQSYSLVYSNKNVYLHFGYKQDIHDHEKLPIKEAGIDVGVNNLLSIFINDKTSPSLIVDGTPYKKYNSDFNRLVGKLNVSISKEVIEWREGENEIKYPLKYSKRGYELKNLKTFLYEKRNRYFYDQFHKISKRVVEYFVKYDVTNIILSYNLAELKYNGKCKLSKRVKQNFIQIPFIKLLDYIQYKANENGILVDCIDESYTSKTSCISDDVNHPLDKELNGVRSKRGLFKDNAINKVFNADLNGAVNHIKKQYVDLDFSWLTNYLFKLNNPIKIKCDYEFCLQNSGSSKEYLNSVHTSHLEQFCSGLS